MIRRLVWIGVGNEVEVDRWRERLGPEVDCRLDTRSVSGPVLPADPAWADPGTGQVPADAVLDLLIDQFEASGSASEADWLLGLTQFDLVAPERPFVFGEATVGGCCALVSLARLAEPQSRLIGRAFTTVVHELLHVAGLDHCDSPACVMWPSSTVEDTDHKGDGLCVACEAVFARIRDSDSAAHLA